MNELNSVSLTDFTKLADVIWLKETESLVQPARNSGIFRVIPISANSGESRDFSEIDGEEYASVKGQGDQAARGQVQQGYTNTATVRRFAKNIGITYEMRRYNKYPEVVSRLTNMARQIPNRIDLDLSHWLGFGTATTYTDQDGQTVNIFVGDTLALWSTAHTLRSSSSTYRNRLANNPQLSKGALELIERQAIENTLNQFGEKKVIPFDVLWTTDDPVDINTAREILRSTASPSAANEGVVNVYQARYRHVVLPRVATTAAGAVDTAKRKFWGIASTPYSSAYLAIWDEASAQAPAAGSNAEDVQTDDWDFRLRGAWGVTIVGANFLQFSSGDGAA
mgnify:FL=1